MKLKFTQFFKLKPICQNPACKDSDQMIRHGKDRHGLQRWLCKQCNHTYVEMPDLQPLKSHQRKVPQKGLKSERGKGELYDEVKTKQTLSLTRTAVKGLDEMAEALNISRSELVERVGRKIIPLIIESNNKSN